MKTVNKVELNRVLECLRRAELRFVEELQTSFRNDAEIAKGLDKLEYALEYVQNWDHDMPVCANCSGIYCRSLGDGLLQCLDCDHVWEHSFDREEYGSWTQGVRPVATVDRALAFLQEALEILKHQEVASLVRSCEYLRDSINGLQRCLKTT